VLGGVHVEISLGLYGRRCGAMPRSFHRSAKD